MPTTKIKTIRIVNETGLVRDTKFVDSETGKEALDPEYVKKVIISLDPKAGLVEANITVFASVDVCVPQEKLETDSD